MFAPLRPKQGTSQSPLLPENPKRSEAEADCNEPPVVSLPGIPGPPSQAGLGKSRGKRDVVRMQQRKGACKWAAMCSDLFSTHPPPTRQTMRRPQQTLRLAALLLAGCIFGSTSAFLFPISSRGAPRTQVRVDCDHDGLGPFGEGCTWKYPARPAPPPAIQMGMGTGTTVVARTQCDDLVSIGWVEPPKSPPASNQHHHHTHTRPSHFTPTGLERRDGPPHGVGGGVVGHGGVDGGPCDSWHGGGGGGRPE